ncbi:UNVERIFIED_CONTAM: hypothetical protein K2H54_057726 [Gekko kuhli]
MQQELAFPCEVLSQWPGIYSRARRWVQQEMAGLHFSMPASSGPLGWWGALSLWPGLLPIVSPRHRSCLQEKEGSLHRGLVGLGGGRAALKLHLARQEEEAGGGSGHQEGLLQQCYELAEVCHLLDDQAANHASLQLELSALCDQHCQLRGRVIRLVAHSIRENLQTCFFFF